MSIGKDREPVYQILYQNFPESWTHAVLLMRLQSFGTKGFAKVARVRPASTFAAAANGIDISVAAIEM